MRSSLGQQRRTINNTNRKGLLRNQEQCARVRRWFIMVAFAQRLSLRMFPPLRLRFALVIILISMLAMRAAHAGEEKWPAIPGKGITVFAAGDIGECWKKHVRMTGPDITAHIVEQGLADNPGAQVLTLGDNTYPVG